MRKLLFALAIALLPCAAFAQIANVTQQGCVYFAAPNTATNAQYVQVLCDPQGRVITSTQASSSASAGNVPVVAPATTSQAVFKASPGNLYSTYATATTAGWLMIFNSTTVPGNGAVTAGVASGNLQDCIYVSANSSVAINYAPMPPEVFSVGISAVFSSTGCATLTLSTNAFIHGSAL